MKINKDLVNFNLNSNVIVCLNKKGKEILRNYFDSEDISTWKCKKLPDYYELQFWMFIDIFGKYQFTGCYAPFSTSVFLYRKDIIKV